MEMSSGRKSDLMKLILLKAGIPLAFSMAGIYSMIITRRKSSAHETQGTHLICQEEIDEVVEDAQVVDSVVSLRVRDRPIVEEAVLGLQNKLGVLMDREQELERKFLRYWELKEVEIVMLELRNMLLLEVAHVESLGMMVESMEEEKRRLDEVLVEYVRLVKELESVKLENVSLQKKVKKLLKVSGHNSRVLGRQNSLLKAKDEEIIRFHLELEGKTHVVRELEKEVTEMKQTVDQLQEEKKELIERLEFAESSASPASKNGDEETVSEEQDHLLAELEQLRETHAAEDEELIHLRWVNACLKHKLMMIQGQHVHDQEEHIKRQEVHDERGIHIPGYNSDDASTRAREHCHTCVGGHKKPKLLCRLKKLVQSGEGHRRSWDEKDDKHKLVKNDEGHRRRSWDEKDHKHKLRDIHSAARKSCSSA